MLATVLVRRNSVTIDTNVHVGCFSDLVRPMLPQVKILQPKLLQANGFCSLKTSLESLPQCCAIPCSELFATELLHT